MLSLLRFLFVAGTYSVALLNSAVNRSYVLTYTISAANTWQYFKLTAPGDTTGTWDKVGGAGIWVIFDNGCGSNYETAAGSWASGRYHRTAASAKAVQAASTFNFTGVQLEVGTVATSFEHRNWALEVALCQRYYVMMHGSVRFTAAAAGYTSTTPVYLPQMRVTPTITDIAAGSVANLALRQWAQIGTNSASYTIQSAAAGDTYSIGGAATFNAEF
jgi:hypothetical protein